MAKAPLKIYFYTAEGVGRKNACVGMAQALARRGHSVSFLLNDKMAGEFAQFGFEEILLTQKAPPKPTADKNEAQVPAENPLKEMAKMVLNSDLLGDDLPIDKLKGHLENSFTDKFEPLAFLNVQIDVALKAGKPDLLIVDSFLVPPAILMAPVPWMTLCSAQPFCILPKKEKSVPVGESLPAITKPKDLSEIPPLINQFQNGIFDGKMQDELNAQFNCKLDYVLNEGDGIYPVSPFLNIYGYPEELAYPDKLPDPENYIRVDAFFEKTPSALAHLRADFEQLGVKVIYFSMGTMGSLNVPLMKRITDMLGSRPEQYRVLVSKGPLADEYELPGNCYGGSFLPQTQMLPIVDLVITHGGVNTTTETFAFGKPMILMPLYDPQYNAQRIEEAGYGIRLEPYTCTEEQLFEAIDKLLHDQPLHQRLKKAAQRMDNSKSKELACQKIEEIVAKSKQK